MPRLGALIAAPLILVASAGAQGVVPAQPPEDPIVRVVAEVEFGPDLGQSLGTLFEARTADGRFVVGAGFCDTYGTMCRSDRHVLQFYLRRTDGARELTLERRPRPWDTHAGTYMYSVNGRVFALRDLSETTVRAWDEATASWQECRTVAPIRMAVGDGILAMGNSRVAYDDELILDAPARGFYACFYYANGFLCFYHIDRGEGGYRDYVSDDDGFSRLYACPWRPGQGAIDLAQATVLTLPYVGETTFAWGTFDGRVLTGSNLGGFYAFDGSTWSMLREPALGTSFQIYTMVPLYDRLLLGQYPSGVLWQFDGETLSQCDGWPPVMPGASPGARECQTAIVWGGELFVGVWPWAELWRYNPDADAWSFVGRMFTHPEVTADPVHPYEKECRERDLVLNQWGQRLTSLVPSGSTLLASTSAKWPIDLAEPPDFMAPEALSEYGSVIAIRTPGCISAPITWTEGATGFEFSITGDTMTIRQDGRSLAAAPLDEHMAAALAAAGDLTPLRSGSGVYGPFGGTSVRCDAR